MQECKFGNFYNHFIRNFLFILLLLLFCRKIQEEINRKQLPDIKFDPGNVRYLHHPSPLTKRTFTYIPGIQAYPEVDYYYLDGIILFLSHT